MQALPDGASVVTRMLEVECGDMRQVLRSLPENSFDSIVSDPPYELGFMGKAWDSTGIAFDPRAWAEAYRVLKPGAHIVAFGGTRTWHRIAVAIEDAGFQIRDSLAWLYGQGFPKSMNLSKAIQAKGGPEAIRRMEMGEDYEPSGRGRKNYDHGAGSAMNGTRDAASPVNDLAKKWEGWGTALKPSFEPIILARKPPIGTIAQNVEAFGVGGLNIDACRGEEGSGSKGCPYWPEKCGGHDCNTFSKTFHGSPPAGWPDEIKGRWPPNVCVDEEVAADLDETNGVRTSQPYKGGPKQKRGQVIDLEDIAPGGYADTGGVSRYFYCPKAGSKERDAGLEHWPTLSPAELTGRADSDAPGTRNPRSGASASKSGGRRNPHPTVKPLALMRWLCKLVTPPGGFILDPFAGSGTTGCAAALEGFHFAGVELDPVHTRLAMDRIAYWFKSISVDKV
jgi:site-specific DNA-methyltransferase (adenine-specific)